MHLLLMFDQICFLIECLLTVVALIVFDAKMNCVEVGLKIILVRRFEVAHLAVKGLQTEMILFVMVQFALELEPLVALVTRKRPLVGMTADHVSFEMVLARASELALVTLEWFFALKQVLIVKFKYRTLLETSLHLHSSIK